MTMLYREYPRGIRLSGITGFGGNNLKECSKRGVITAFSQASRKRLGWVYEQGPWVSMLTFTYHDIFPHDFKESKRHLNNLKKWLHRRNIKFLWVLEWQRRGFPHYHVWLDKQFDDVPLWEDSGKNSWRPIMEEWLKITGQENDDKAKDFSFHQGQYTNWVVTVNSNYACKYANKNEQKVLPGPWEDVKRFGRWWGCSRDLKLEKEVIEVACDDACPEKSQATIRGWKQVRRQVKRFIERKFNFKFSRDAIGSRLSVRWTMNEQYVACVNRLFFYYSS